MSVKNLTILCLLCLALTGKVFAQTPAQEMEDLLASSGVSYAQAARFVLDASESFVTKDTDEAFRYAQQNNWLKKVQPEETARLDAISLLIMKSFDIKGGIFYSLTKSPHYAYRELSYKKIIAGRADPAMTVSGEQLLFMVGRILADRDREMIAKQKEREAREAREAAKRREVLAAEISARLVEQEVADTTVEATEQGVTITLTDIQFYADSARLDSSEQSKLREIANILGNLSDIKVLVAGHTALAGDEAGRNALSLARAQTVANYLVSLGACKADSITAVGFGADRPVATNATPQGMAANRRVEITILEN